MPHVFLGSPEFTAPLAAEIGPEAEIVAPGIVAAPAGGPPRDLVFARQVLPDAVEIRAPSVAKLVNGAFGALLPILDPGEDRIALHALVAEGVERRADLLAAAFLDVAKARRRRVHRRFAAAGEPAEILVQLLAVARDRLFAAAARPARLPRGGEWPVWWPGGEAPVAEDPAAPSSAYRKLEEAFAWLGRRIRPGDRVVDLGASPGGWTHVALRDGAAEVTAVDRAELDPRILADPRVVHHRRTAHTFTPEAPPYDWLLCDVIAYPEKSVDLLARWVEAGWAKNLVFHLKFKGPPDFASIDKARAILDGAPFPFVRVKHLRHDKNEATLLAGSP